MATRPCYNIREEEALESDFASVTTSSQIPNVSSYLDLSLAKEANGGLVSESPEVGLGEVHGIIETEDGVALIGKSFQVGLGLTKGRAGDSLLDRGESGSRGKESGKDGKLHFVI
jgi:hypothetical protein